MEANDDRVAAGSHNNDANQVGRENVISNNNVSGMHELIPVVNKLQDVFSKAGLPAINSMKLPQIVVVGSQSVGKSSVLESFVGHAFLPRGDDIVTRRPLVIQMVTDFEDEYCEFLHETAPRRRYREFLAVRQEIINETTRLAPGKTISLEPINLSIHSPNVLNLTVVDLPGLTVARIGEQPEGIQLQIRNLVLQYAKPENALILAVSAGNTDLANSAAMDIAQEVDPKGERTISVITKLDLEVDGKDARAILTNKLHPLKLGHVGVVNFKQGEKTLREARKAEREFFKNHRAYYDIAERCGTPFLQAVLNVQLGLHIRKHLPRLRDTLRQQLRRIQPEADEFKKLAASDEASVIAHRSKDLIAIVQDLAHAFGTAMEATSNLASADEERQDKLNGGARINKVFFVTFSNRMRQVEKIKGEDCLSDRDVALRIRNIIGLQQDIFPPPQAFYGIVRERIRKMQTPSDNCVNDVVREVSRTFSQLLDKSKIRYPALRSAIEHMFESHLNTLQKKTMEHIHLFIDCHVSYMNTSHKDFPSISEILRDDGATLGFSTTTTSRQTSDGGAPPETRTKEPPLVARSGEAAITDRRLQSDPRDPTTFSLQYRSGSNPDKEVALELTLQTADESAGWQADFERVGFVWQNKPAAVAENAISTVEVDSQFPSNKASSDNGGSDEPTDEDLRLDDPQMLKKISQIRELVLAYLPIISVTVRDFIPKCICHLLIDGLREYLRYDFLNELQQRVSGEAVRLMQEPQAMVEQRKKMISLYEATEEALRIISETTLPDTPAVSATLTENNNATVTV